MELETKLKEKETEFQIQLEQEINPLKDQVQIHTQTTGILIAEKAELTSALCQAQQSAKQNSGLLFYYFNSLNLFDLYIIMILNF